MTIEDLRKKIKYDKSPLFDDNLWSPIDINEKSEENPKEDYEFYKKMAEKASEKELRNIISIIEDRFQFESKESIIACKNSAKQSSSLSIENISYNLKCKDNECLIHGREQRKTVSENKSHLI